MFQKLKNSIKTLKLFNKKPKHKFPCEDCLILATGDCREVCEKVEMDEDKIKELFETHMVCIDCGHKNLLEGPCGGLSQNVKCAKCGHKFNFGPPLFIHRIE